MSTFETYLGAELLTEAAWGQKTSAILPSGRVLFNKNKVTPDHAVSKEGGVWGDGAQHVRTYKWHDWKPSDKHGNGGGDVEKFFHVASFGHYNPESGHDTAIGAKEEFHHSQSMRALPSAHLVGVSNYQDGKKISHHGEDHSKKAAALHVYK